MGIVSQKVILPEWGKVNIKCLSTARRVSARWRSDGLHVTVPPGLSADQFKRILDSMAPDLRRLRPDLENRPPLYFDGFTYSGDGWSIDMHKESRLAPDRLHIKNELDTGSGHISYHIYYGVGIDPVKNEAFLAKNILKAARHFVHVRVIPEAIEIARGLGVSVAGWDTMRGATRLGKCSASGKIWLNERLAFYDRELRRSTITHELAHRTHFDHSPAFHALWERYMGCTNATLKERRRATPLPLPPR